MLTFLFINQTVITGNHNVAIADGWTTFIVVWPYFVPVIITIRNTAGSVKHQAVALRNGMIYRHSTATISKVTKTHYRHTSYVSSTANVIFMVQ